MSAPLLALVWFGLAATEASAVVEQPPRSSLSIEVPGLLWEAFEVVGERFVHPHLSLLLGVGARFAGEGDFSGYTLGLGVGARFWLNRFQLGGALGGPVVGLRVDPAWTRIEAKQRPGAALETVSAAVSLRLGYRFVIARRMEITPEAGLAITLGFDRAPWLVVVPRPGLVLGLTLGYLF